MTDEHILNIEMSAGSGAYDCARQILQLLYNEYKATNSVYRGDNGGILSYVNPNSQHWGIKWADDSHSRLVVWVEIPTYWQALEEGRQPTRKGQAGVLYPAILAWVKAKGIAPTPRQRISPKTRKPIGKPYRPTQEQLAHAITAKIHKFGFFGYDQHGKHIMENALNRAQQMGVIEELAHSIRDDIGREVDVYFSDMVQVPLKK